MTGMALGGLVGLLIIAAIYGFQAALENARLDMVIDGDKWYQSPSFWRAMQLLLCLVALLGLIIVMLLRRGP